VDQEKEPCGCPPALKGSNDFPLAQSEGLAPILHPDTSVQQVGHEAQSSETLSYNSAEHAPKAPATQPAVVAPPIAAPPAPVVTEPPPPQLPPPAPPAKKKAGFFKHIGNFFKKVFGSE
jgi:hypothetical protein